MSQAAGEVAAQGRFERIEALRHGSGAAPR